MKFIHAADLHCDRSFEGIGKTPRSLANIFIQANQQMIIDLVEQALHHQVDFILLAGDTFHQERISIQVQRFFMQQMERLSEAEIPVVMIFGNHDYVEENRFWFSFPDNVYILYGSKVTTIHLQLKNGEKVAISGFSYHSPHINESQVKYYPTRDKNANYHIGMYHGEVEFGKNQQFAPFKLRELKEKNYDYWALGHIHQPSILQESHPTVVYPGTPQGHNRKEKTAKGVLFVEMQGDTVEYQFLDVASIVWKTVECRLGNISSLTELLPLLVKGVLPTNQDFPKKLSLISIKLVGDNPVLQTELEQKLKNNELLTHLQTAVFQKSNEKIWVYDIHQEQTFEESELPLGVPQDLLYQLAEKYETSEKFDLITDALSQQPILMEMIPNHPEHRKLLIEEAVESFIQSLGVRKEGR